MNTDHIPGHVPPHLVKHFDYTDMQGETDVFRHFKKLHYGPDLFYTPCNGGHWVVTRYADMEAIMENHQDFSSHHSSLPRNPFPLPLLESDEPIHTDYRHLLAPFFTPKSIGNLEKKAQDVTHQLLDSFYAQGECEFTRDFGQKMPIMILMSLLNLPDEDTPYLLNLSEEIVRGGKPEIIGAAFQKLGFYIATQVLLARRANPGNDIFSALIAGKVQGDRSLSDEELIAIGCLLIGAGLDTVASMMGFLAMFLAQNPTHRQHLLDHPERLVKSLEEMMRRHHIANTARVATRDLAFKGVQFKQGDAVMTPTTLAGIDEQRYPDALTVDFNRTDHKNLVFGRGAHQCIGAFLARTELRVFLTEWLKRIPHFEVKAGETPVSKVGKANAVIYLPLTWTPTA